MNYIDEMAERIRRLVPPDLMPSGDTTQLFRIYAVLALTVGRRVQGSHVHDGWSAWVASTQPDHPSLRPYSELAPEVRRQDDAFVAAIRDAAQAS